MATMSYALRKRLAEKNTPTETKAKDTAPTDDSVRFRERLKREAARLEAQRSGVFPDAGINDTLGGREIPMSSGGFYLVEPDAAAGPGRDHARTADSGLRDRGRDRRRHGGGRPRPRSRAVRPRSAQHGRPPPERLGAPPRPLDFQFSPRTHGIPVRR